MSEPEAKREPESGRKPYSSPRLTEYGPVEKLTHSGTSNLGDGGPMMMPCL